MLNSLKHYINHIIFVVDRSGSMASIASETVKVFDNQIAHLAKRSKEMDQETRVSVYLFNGTVECLVHDIDVMRLPSLANHYSAGGSTALIQGAMTAIKELQTDTPQRYGDHAFLMYVLTDGENTDSGHLAPQLTKQINGLPDNWTVAVLVPNQNGVHEAKQFGFPAENISVWSTTKGGISEAGETMKKATENFMRGRATGVRSTKSLFALDASNLNSRKVRDNLDALEASKYKLLPVKNVAPIREFVEQSTKKPYQPGSAYYQITKTEEVQGYKQICIRNQTSNRIYTGDNARKLLNLPNTTVKVKPTDTGGYDIFVQSTSVNRKLVPGTQLLVLI